MLSLHFVNRFRYRAVSTPTTYANYPFKIQELSGSKGVLSLQTPATIANVPLVPITPANQAAATTWAGRSVQMRATFSKK